MALFPIKVHKHTFIICFSSLLFLSATNQGCSLGTKSEDFIHHNPWHQGSTPLATLNRLNTKEKKVVLTFDDGPSAAHTQNILNTLEKYKITAVFFVLGDNAKRHPNLIKAMVQKGHTIGHHSQTHANMFKISIDQRRQELDTPLSVLKGIIPEHKIHFFRPPYGNWDKALKKEVHARGLQLVMWSIDPKDWDKNIKTSITASVLKQLHPGGIILLHDIHKRTAEQLEQVIQMILKAGYTFTNLPTPPNPKAP